MDGRLTNANHLPYDMKHPIILPRGHDVTKLIVKHHEKANQAGGVNFILAQLSPRFWIIAAREGIRSWENECKKRKTKLATQIMAPPSKFVLGLPIVYLTRALWTMRGLLSWFKVRGDSDKSDGYACSRVLRQELSIWKWLGHWTPRVF